MRGEKMSVLDWFKKNLKIKKEGTWKELGSYNSQFTSFGADLYKSDIIRSCIRPISEHTSKANAVCTDKNIEKILNVSPNMYMTGKDFLAKVRTRLELQNTAFIYIFRDDKGKATGFYPVPYKSFEAVECSGRLYLQFNFEGFYSQPLICSWNDLAVLRKDYNKSDIAGDSNNAILDLLELINTTNQGIGNAVKATANLRGILKNTKQMLSDEDTKKSRDRFVRDYLNLENAGGIASLDNTQEFQPISMNPTVADWNTIKEFRENVYRYFGVSDAIVMSNYTESQMEAFYDARIEPFLVALSLELTRKIFTQRELGFGNQVVYESNRIQYASTTTKLNMVQLVDRGALTPNEWRQMFNLSPVDGGDVPIRRLDTAEVNAEPITETEQEENEDDQQE